MAAETMRAVVADAPGDPDVLHVTRLPIPSPGPGEVRLRVAYCSLNPVDVFARQGRWPGKYPLTPGTTHSGIVDKVGDGVDRQWLGRRVLSSGAGGGCADFSIGALTMVAPFPEGLDWKVGTVYRGITATAWHSVVTAARVQRGDNVAIHSGAGPIGIVMTQIAKELGATVIALCGGPDKIAYARPYGADHFIDYRRDDWPADVIRLTGGRGADVIIDGNGGAGWAKNYEAIAANGLILLMGATAGRGPDIPQELLMRKSIKVGAMSFPVLGPILKGRDDAMLLDAVRTGRWRIPISEEVALEDVPALHARFERRETKGRVVIRVGGDL